MGFANRPSGTSTLIDADVVRALTRRLVAAPDHDAIVQAIVEGAPDGHRPSPALLAVQTSCGTITLASRMEVPDSVQLPTIVPDDPGIPLVHAMDQRSPLWIETVEERDRWFPDAEAYGPAPLAAAVLPLEVGEVLVGAIGLFYWYEHRFTERERRLYQLIADLSALAVERLGRLQDPTLN